MVRPAPSSSRTADARKGTTTAVAEHLKNRVRRGSLAPGQRLVEVDIMQETGASRGRVREALRQLASEGIVIIEAYRGASVRRLSRDDVDQIYRAREALEGAAARLFAERLQPAQLQQVQALQAQMDACESSGDREAYGLLNDRWHALILRACGNSYVEVFVERLRLPIFRLQFSMFYSGEAMRLSNAGHRKVTSAITAGDGDAAETEMRAHIREGLSAIGDSDDEFFAN